MCLSLVGLGFHLGGSSFLAMGTAHEGRAFDIIGEVATFKRLFGVASLGRLVSECQK